MTEGDTLRVHTGSHVKTPDFTAGTCPYCNDASTSLAVIASFWVYKPLTYYQWPLAAADLERRALVRMWDLRCPVCPRADGLCRSPTP